MCVPSCFTAVSEEDRVVMHGAAVSRPSTLSEHIIVVKGPEAKGKLL